MKTLFIVVIFSRESSSNHQMARLAQKCYDRNELIVCLSLIFECRIGKKDPELLA